MNGRQQARFSTALIRVGLGLVLAVGSALAQESGTTVEDGGVEENELVAAKWIYVGPMPEDYETWIIEFLRQWGKYKVTGDPEGVDLVWQANIPRPGYRIRKNRQGYSVCSILAGNALNVLQVVFPSVPFPWIRSASFPGSPT